MISKDFKELAKVFGGMRVGELLDSEFEDAVNRNLTTTFVGFKVELRIHRAMLRMIDGILESFPTTLEEDEAILRNRKDLSANARTAVINRKGTKELLQAAKVFTVQQWLSYITNENY